jgi:hypothetical protein
MGTDAHVFLSDLARGLAPRADQLGDVVLHHLLDELPEVWKYEDIASGAPVALSEHIAAVLDLLERGLGMTEARTPPAAIEFACRLADASSTAPHLRRARVFDEGSRGLLLIAQLTEH